MQWSGGGKPFKEAAKQLSGYAAKLEAAGLKAARQLRSISLISPISSLMLNKYFPRPIKENDLRAEDARRSRICLLRAGQERVRERGLKCAFTLAEVLITLGIIGIVAAMTIPTLINNFQERSWNSAASTFEGRLGQALSVMNTQHVLGVYPSTEAFVSELKKYLKISDVCANSELSKCFEDAFVVEDKEKTLSKFRTSKDFGRMAWNTNIVGIRTLNGISALIAYNPQCKDDPYSNQTVGFTGGVSKNNGSVRISSDCVSVLYDTSGLKNPNTFSKDVRGINVGFPVCVDDSQCFKTAKLVDTPLNCSSVADNDDAQYCAGATHSQDYWAMANKICGGNSNLPSMNDLLDIYYYLHGENNSKYEERAAEFGFPTTGTYSVWAKEERDVNSASKRDFAPWTSYNQGSGWTNKYPSWGRNLYAVCVFVN